MRVLSTLHSTYEAPRYAVYLPTRLRIRHVRMYFCFTRCDLSLLARQVEALWLFRNLAMVKMENPQVGTQLNPARLPNSGLPSFQYLINPTPRSELRRCEKGAAQTASLPLLEMVSVSIEPVSSDDSPESQPSCYGRCPPAHQV